MKKFAMLALENNGKKSYTEVRNYITSANTETKHVVFAARERWFDKTLDESQRRELNEMKKFYCWRIPQGINLEIVRKANSITEGLRAFLITQELGLFFVNELAVIEIKEQDGKKEAVMTDADQKLTATDKRSKDWTLYEIKEIE